MKFWHVLLAFLLLLSALAKAEPSAPAYRVVVTAAGAREPTSALEARTRALLRDYPVELEWSLAAHFHPRDVFEPTPQTPPSEAPTLARIWLDARETTRAVLYLVDDAHERFLVRVVPLEAGYDEVACESVGTIIQTSVEALLAGATLGVSRQAAEEQVADLEGAAPAKAAPEKPVGAEPSVRPAIDSAAPDPYRVALDVSYRGQLLSAGPEILHGPELGLSLFRRAARFGGLGFLSIGYRAPLHWDEDGVGATFQGLGGRAGIGPRWAVAQRLSLSLLGTVGVDGLLVQPVVSEPGAAARRAFWIATATLGLGLEAELGLSRRVSLWLAPGAEVDLSGHHFDVLEGGQPVPVLEAWTVQPVLRLGLRFRP